MDKPEMTAPKIDELISSIDDQMGIIDRECLERLSPIIDSMSEIEIQGDDELRSIWIEAPRGDISDFGDYDEFKEEGIVDDHEGFIEEWRSYYPEDRKWYAFSISSYQGNYYFSIGHEKSFQTGEPIQKKYFGCLPDELLEWLTSKVRITIDQLRKDQVIYNEYLEKNLPHSKRFGGILRRDLWEIFPEVEKMIRGDLTDKDIELLEEIVLLSKGPPKKIDKMTAGYFYDLCRIGYMANKYDRVSKPGMSSKEMYRAMADGRDCGLDRIDVGSEEEFRYWYHHGAHCGGHPWEICSGGNSTHISLYVTEKDGKWELTLCGSSFVRVLETVKIALAFHAKDIPFKLHEAEEILRMITGSDYVGIVPEHIFPRYCHSLFPKEDRIIDFMNLGWEETDRIIEKALWYPLKGISLKNEGQGKE